RGYGTERGRVPLTASGLLGLARLRFLAAERVGLAMLFASGFVQAVAEFAVLLFHLGQAAFQAVVVSPEGLDFRGQPRDASAEVQDLAVPLLTAWTRGTTRKHGALPKDSSRKAGWSAWCGSSRCTSILGPRSRNWTNSDLPRPIWGFRRNLKWR